MTTSEAHQVWAKKVNGLPVTREEILEARKAYEERIEEWRKLDDMDREYIGDQEMLKVFNDNPQAKEAADKMIEKYKKARKLADEFIRSNESELADL